MRDLLLNALDCVTKAAEGGDVKKMLEDSVADFEDEVDLKQFP